ncbi:MAG: glycosyltransferase [Candidatus Micrarchaeota archaeon]
MRISVIIPTHNEEKMIERSLAKHLAQTRLADEVIIVDDSSDKTPEIVREYEKKTSGRVKLVHFSERRGVSFARNQGAKAAKGELLIFIDADIMLDPNCIEEIEKVMAKTGVRAATWKSKRAKPETFMEKCYWVRATHYGESRGSEEAFIVPACYTRELFDEIGGYNEKLKYFEDREIADKLKKKGVKVEEVNAYISHLDPSSIADFTKQASWLGGSLTLEVIKKRLRNILHPLAPAHWGFVFLFALLGLIYYPFFYLSALLLAVVVFEAFRCIWLTKMVFPSFGYVVLSCARAFIIAFSYLYALIRRLIKPQSS